jgi:CheY-like chemotaxis protein
VSGNAAELRELLTNLIFNAVDAMPDGGAITISVRPTAGKVVVQVSDEGTGMSEETRARCLEPFFTTKGEQGTGLGLAMVYGIAQRHHATLELESELGHGTTFRFHFAPEVVDTQPGETAPVRFAHALRVLVVDDQPFICEIMEQYLSGDGHTVTTACDGELALVRLLEGEFDLVLTDHEMPDMTGAELAAAAKGIRPRLPVILLTGYGTDGALEHPAIDLVLGKPVSIETLRAALVDVFEGNGAQRGEESGK